MKDNRKTIQVLVILTLIFAIAGGTLAYWQWTTNTEQKTNVVFTITQDFSCSADGGGNISQADVKLAPTSCTDASRAIKRKVRVTPTLDRNNLTVSLDLWLNVHELGEGLKRSNNFRYVLTTSSTSCEEGTIISEGNFKGRKTGDKIPLITNDLHTVTESEEYWLYIWLDKEETNSNTMNQKFNLSLGGVCDEVETLKGDAYAIYTEEDKTLTFVRSEAPITTSDLHNGKSITAVYSGIETITTDAPWYGDNRYTNITRVIFNDTIRPISTAYWFSNMLIEDYALDLAKLDTSQVINMSYMFEASNVTTDISHFDVSNVRDMSSMLGGEVSLQNVGDISSWDVSNVRDMSDMFWAANGEDLNLSSWDVSNVRDMSYMFTLCNSIKNLDISLWNVSNVTNMESMFNQSIFQSLGDISSWDTSNVTNMSEMFYCASFDGTLDISSWDVSNVTRYSGFGHRDIISPFVEINLVSPEEGILYAKKGTTWGEFALANGGWIMDGNVVSLYDSRIAKNADGSIMYAEDVMESGEYYLVDYSI